MKIIKMQNAEKFYNWCVLLNMNIDESSVRYETVSSTQPTKVEELFLFSQNILICVPVTIS